MNQKWLRNSFIYLLILVAVVAILFTVFQPSSGGNNTDITSVITMAKKGELKEIQVDGDNVTAITNDGTKLHSRKESSVSLLQLLGTDSGVKVAVKQSSSLSNVFGILINFLPLIFFGGLILFMMRQAQGTNNQAMSFGRSRARMFVGNRPSVTFADVAGVDEAKVELQEVVEFLKYPEKFMSLGARVPKGVLLVGSPGTGKTLLARAVAGEAGTPFFSISGSEFVEMFVGVGASRVRDLFDQAKRNSPCIVFVDEIDAVGRHRGAGLGGGHDEREQTLNQILVEMDGFDTGTNIIVIAATNRPDILDPALLRPGRFDRRVVLDLPDVNGRKAILQVHAKGKPLETTVDLENLAKQTPGFSGADLANLINEGAILAARRNKKTITMDELEEAVDRVIAGPERKSRLISLKEKEITAHHEAGHALVARLTSNADPVHKISIVARGMSLGHTRQLPSEDRYLYTKNQMEAMLAVYMGGRAAEDISFGQTTTGASDDLEKATKIARRMITTFGMTEKSTHEEMAISTVVELALAGNIATIEVYGHDLLVRTKDNRVFRSRKEHDFSLVEFLREQGVNTQADGVQVVVKESGSLGGLGPRTFGHKEELVFLGREITEQRDYSDKVAEYIDEEIARLIERADASAHEILSKNKAKLVQIAKTLIVKETLEGKELEELFNSVPPEVNGSGSEVPATAKQEAPAG